ncbi:hypothetical protein R1sor_001436 [Riccia sorocarpa]|uniref:F-box domain-containing protein n=1 Tax=Riccia sorocarpa TaxID=122646 RepID=A0ABD3GYJ4_9MARC
MTLQKESTPISGRTNSELYRGRQARQRTVYDFGTDIFLRIFSCLDPGSLAICSAVCTSWHSVITNYPSLWKTAYFLYIERGRARKEQAASTSSRTPSDKTWKASYVEEEQKLLLRGPSSYRSWKAHSGRVNCCKMVMGLVASGSSDQMARIWSVDSLQCLEQYKVPQKAPVVQIDFDENKVIGAAGKEVLLWSRSANRRLLRRMGGHSEICSMSYTDPDVIVGCVDGTVRVFDLYSGRCTQIFRNHTDSVKGVVLDTDSQVIASGSADGKVELYDAHSGQKVVSFLRPPSATGITCLQLSLPTHTLFAGSWGGDLYCFDLRKRKTLWRTRVGGNAVTCMHSPVYSSSVIATGGMDGVVKAFKTVSGERILTTLEPRKPPRMAPSPIVSIALGLTRIVTAHTDSFMAIYSLGASRT